MFYIILALPFISVGLLVYRELGRSQSKSILILGGILLVLGLALLPFFDPFLLDYWLASIILGRKLPNLFTILFGLIVLNCCVYGIHILASSISLKYAEKDSGKILYTEQYSKRRHPILASYGLIGLGFEVLMGSVTGVILMTGLIILFVYESVHLEKTVLIPRHGQVYKGYMKNVPHRLFSMDVMLLLSIEYVIFFLTILLFI